MRRRIIGPACVLTACAAIVSSGCETLRPSTRKQVEDVTEEVAVEAEDIARGSASKIPSVTSDPRKPSPFFKNNRLTGGLSDQARDIESSLGVR